MANNPYPLPNDDVEKDRLDGLQECFRALIGGNIVVPIRPTPAQIGIAVLESRSRTNQSRYRNRFWEMGVRGCERIPIDSCRRA